MRGNLGGRPVGGKDKEPCTRWSANSSELEVKAKKRQATKLQLQPKGAVICRGPLQAMEQLLLQVEAALVQHSIPRLLLDR